MWKSSQNIFTISFAWKLHVKHGNCPSIIQLNFSVTSYFLKAMKSPTITFEDANCLVYLWQYFLAFLLGVTSRVCRGSCGEAEVSCRSHKSSSAHLFALWHVFKENPRLQMNLLPSLAQVWLVQRSVTLVFFGTVQKMINAVAKQWTRTHNSWNRPDPQKISLGNVMCIFSTFSISSNSFPTELCSNETLHSPLAGAIMWRSECLLLQL